MNPLASRKQLLLAESELNRSLIAGEVAALQADVHTLAQRAKAVRSITSLTAVLVAGLIAFRRHKPADAAANPSWWQIMFKCAGLISTIWLAFRPLGRDRDGV